MYRVMVVDDEAAITTQLEERLTLMGYEVVGSASSGQEAVEMAKRIRPDIVLMDIVMPGSLDGIDASEIIKVELDIPVIFLTAYASEKFVNKAKDVEPFGYIVKPFQEKEIKATIEVALYKKNIERRLSESEEKYRSLVESTEDSIYLLDRNCKYLFMNKEHLLRLGLEAEKVKGRKYSEFQTEDDSKEFEEKVKEVFETGNSIQHKHERPEESKYFLRTLSPVKNAEGRTVSVTVVSKDITGLKRAEEALRRSNEELLKAHDQRKILSKSLIELLEKDRRQIAMELHDHIGQTLTSLKMNLEMIHRKLKSGHTELGAQITTAQERTIQAIKDVRNVSHGLRPAMIDALGVVSALRELFNEIQQQTDIEVHFFSQGTPKRFAEAKELAIYRIAQEALNNIIRHARAKNVFVNLVKKDENLSLSVEDDGVGFDQDKVMKPSKKKGPLGLLIMRERAVQLDGEFTIESQPGKGTNLLVEIPL